MKTETFIDVGGLDRAAMVAALYNAARCQGLGFLQYRDGVMSRDDAVEALAERPQGFDYLHGRVMKIHFSMDDPPDRLRVTLYDRDNGAGAAVAALRQMEGWRDDRVSAHRHEGLNSGA